MTDKSLVPEQIDRQRAESFRRGSGGKYDRDVEHLAEAFTAHRLAEQERCAGVATAAIRSGSSPEPIAKEPLTGERAPEFFYPIEDDDPSKLAGEQVWLWHRFWDHARLGWYDQDAGWWKIGFNHDGEWWGVGVPPSHLARVTPREYVGREREITLADTDFALRHPEPVKDTGEMARELLASHGRFPSGNSVPFDVAERIVAAALTRQAKVEGEE